MYSRGGYGYPSSNRYSSGGGGGSSRFPRGGGTGRGWMGEGGSGYGGPMMNGGDAYLDGYSSSSGLSDYSNDDGYGGDGVYPGGVNYGGGGGRAYGVGGGGNDDGLIYLEASAYPRDWQQRLTHAVGPDHIARTLPLYLRMLSNVRPEDGPDDIICIPPELVPAWIASPRRQIMEDALADARRRGAAPAPLRASRNRRGAVSDGAMGFASPQIGGYLEPGTPTGQFLLAPPPAAAASVSPQITNGMDGTTDLPDGVPAEHHHHHPRRHRTQHQQHHQRSNRTAPNGSETPAPPDGGAHRRRRRHHHRRQGGSGGGAMGNGM